jgi:type IV pilus assembly protein PilM
LPAIKQEEVAEAIKWELEANIPHAIDEIYYDWQIIELAKANPKKLDVLVGVLPKKTVDPYLDVLKKAGLKPFIFEIESVATARALVEKDRKEPIAIVDIGGQRTSFFAIADQTIYFTASIPISNNYLVKVLSEHLGVSTQKAREIKIKMGLDSQHPKSKIFEALKPPLIEMTAKIKSFIEFCCELQSSGQSTGIQIKDLVLCGGGAKLVGLADFFSSQLKLNVTLGNPWANFQENPEKIIGELPFIDPPAYATAIGLALRNFNNNDSHD